MESGASDEVHCGEGATIPDAEGPVLLVHRTDCDWWWQPGVGDGVQRDPPDGVIRKVWEETGFVVTVERLAGVYSWAPRKDELIFSFVCHITAGERWTSDETDDVRFFFPDELPANTFPEHVHRLCDALAGDPKMLLKVAQGPSSRDVARSSIAPEAADTRSSG
jgi:ADP-ribose pyrophosphatase YjhB (NUDIX family)